MQVIPLSSVPSQSLSVNLDGQPCQIAVYTETTGLYLDLSVNQVVLMTSILCRDRVRLVREKYLGFLGDLVFEDITGSSDPVYTGLGTQYQLVFLSQSEL